MTPYSQYTTERARGPEPPPSRQPSDTPTHYRAALALYALRHIPDHGAIATAALDLEQLEETALGLSYALTQRAILTIDDQPQSTPVVVYDRLAATLQFIHARIDARRKDLAATLAKLDTPHTVNIADTHPTPGSGQGVPVPPPPPRPLTGHEAPASHPRERVEIPF